MAASSLLLRSFLLARSHQALPTAGPSIYRSSFLYLRAEALNLRGSHLACRSFSAQALEASVPVVDTRSSKKKKSPASSSWEEAAAHYTRKNAVLGAESGGSVGQGEERKVISDSESVQGRAGQNYAEEEPVVKKKFERRKDKSMNEGSFGNARNATRDGRGRGEFTGQNRGEDGAFSRRQSPDMDSRKGAYSGRGFKEGFPGEGDGRRTSRWNARSDADSRSTYRGNSRTGGFREGFSESRGPARTDGRNGGFRTEFSDGYTHDRSGAFRRQFGESVDTSKGFFQKRNQGGNLGKKQFPDVDGGKRMFKGRFEGDGFVKRQTVEYDNSRKNSYGALNRGQSFSRGSSRTQVLKQSEDEAEDEASSEEEEDESEDIPQAGDVIRYSEMPGIKKEGNYNSRQSHVGVDQSEGELHEEDEDEVESDEDNTGYKRRDVEYVRKELPAMSLPLPKIKGEVVYGVGPIHAALQMSRREFFCLYVQQNMPMGGSNAGKKKDKKAVEWIIRTAIDRGLEVKEVSKHDLNMLADNRPHQGLILDASPLELVVSTHLEEPHTENGKTPVWVALDEVTDPQNFGAILRSAYFLGASGVVVCAKNSAPLSAVVSKASAGALEVMELRSCKNMMKFLDRSTENGWRVVGGSAAGADVSSVKGLPRGLPTILVLGGEGKGLRTNVKRACSELVCIPGLASETKGKRGGLPKPLKQNEEAADVDVEDNKDGNLLRAAREDFIAVDSLNVSVAAGILLHELLNQAATESQSLVEAVLDDEKEQQSEIDAEAVLTTVQEQDSEIDVEAVSSNTAYAEVVATD